MQTGVGYFIEEYHKVRIFRQSVSSHHQIAQCLRDFDKDFPGPLTVTYQAITAYVVRYLPNIRAAAGIATTTMTGRALMSLCGNITPVGSQHESGGTPRCLRGTCTQAPELATTAQVGWKKTEDE
jgi:hypothetical protein